MIVCDQGVRPGADDETVGRIPGDTIAVRRPILNDGPRNPDGVRQVSTDNAIPGTRQDNVDVAVVVKNISHQCVLAAAENNTEIVENKLIAGKAEVFTLAIDNIKAWLSDLVTRYRKLTSRHLPVSANPEDPGRAARRRREGTIGHHEVIQGIHRQADVLAVGGYTNDANALVRRPGHATD